MFIIVKKKIKYVGINLRRHAQNLYKENYKTLLKDKEGDWTNGKDIPSFLDRKILQRKMSVPLKWIYKCTVISIKPLKAYWVREGDYYSF